MEARQRLTSANRYGELWADVYDEEHSFLVPSEAQLSVLADLAGGGRALELGGGTGRVALPLAARGERVEGLHASPSMVARLRSKPDGQDIPVTIGDMADLPVDGPFHLVYVVFNTFFALLAQEDQVGCFERAQVRLASRDRPHGLVGRSCPACLHLEPWVLGGLAFSKRTSPAMSASSSGN
ncbi:MAG TPA: methyltransferase domain-containing protein [Acidimicrobiales bacterium]|nr:methyltransferase domain-containing protein [Acidimicrobiales bacterium]